MNESWSERELTELWLRAREEAASAEELALLNELIEQDEKVRDFIVRLSAQQGWLCWRGMFLPRNSQPVYVANGADAAKRPLDAGSRADRSARGFLSRGMPRRASWLVDLGSFRRVSSTALPAVAIILVVIAAYWLGMHQANREAAIRAPTGELVQARLVSSTQCTWDSPETVQSALHRPFKEGDSLQLLEGIAELQLAIDSTEARLQLEGPAALVLMRQGIPSLRYGKVTVHTEGPQRSMLPIETSFGRVLLRPGGVVGISVFGSSAEIHAFRGMTLVESPWLHSPEEELTGKMIAAGEALYLDHVGGSELRVRHDLARPSRFTTQVSMAADPLTVSRDYVDEIRRASPVAYWRFEAEGAEQITNEVGDRFHGRLRGAAEWVGQDGNRALELGMGTGPGFILVEGPWDPVLQGDFSMEAWIKPSHVHLGSFLGFTGQFNWETRYSGYGVLLEAGGTALPSTSHQPERIRFLHRSQLGAVGGVQCFSDRPYLPRRWQHVVGTRRGKELALYLDGNRVQSAEDESPTPSGLRLVIGQLYSETVARFFVGHIDEVAIYDRALTAEEVHRHFEILRPAPENPNSS